MHPKFIGVFLMLFSGTFLFTAISDVQKSMTDKTPTTVSFSKFEADLPSEGWFNVTDAQLELTEAMWVDDDGKVGNIYIPARKKGSEMGAEQPVSVLVKINDEKLRSFLEKSRDLEKKSDAEQVAFMAANADKLQIA